MYQSIEIAQPIIHCSDEETEAQREAGISQGHTASDRQSRSAWFSSCPSLSATEHTARSLYPGTKTAPCSGLPSLYARLCKPLKRVLGKHLAFI